MKVETNSKQNATKREMTGLEKAFSHVKGNPYAKYSASKVTPKKKELPPELLHKFDRIKTRAKSSPECVFTTLAHLLTPELLTESFGKLNKRAAVGIDGISCEDYQENLDQNIQQLHASLKNRSYTPKPLKRKWIDKGGGKQRPIGISSLEDKIVQRAVTTLLNVIYEQDFYDFSYGFREERNAHQALKYFRDQSMKSYIKWFINADIKGCFDNFSHKIMLELLRKRVNDGTLNWLIKSWMRTGIIDGQEMTVNETGTPQGGIISPVLANIYLHEVIDKWIAEEIRPLLKGAIFIVRYADDFIIGLEYEEDAHRLYKVLPKRLAKYGLELSIEKSRLQNFVPNNPEKENTIDYLGFTHYWTKSRLGSNVIKRRTRLKSKTRILKEMYQMIKQNRHLKLLEQFEAIDRKLRGYYQYYAIRGNFPFLQLIYHKARLFWVKMLNHRGGRKKSYTIETFNQLLRIFTLPKPKILHQI